MFQTPLRCLLILSASLVLTEFGVGQLLDKLALPTPWLHHTLDAALMLILAFPAMYFFVLQPLHREIRDRQRAEAELQVYRETLEQRVEARTHELTNSNLQLESTRHDLNRAQAVARTGSWRLDVRKDELLWSDETYRIFCIPPGTPLTYELFLEHVLPEDRAYVQEEWQAALSGRRPYDIQHRIKAGDAVKWVREKAELEFDAQGALRGGFGTVQDITELKQAHEALEWELAVKEALSALVAPLIYHEATLEQVSGAVSEQVRKLTASPHCLVTCIDPLTKDNVCHAYTEMMSRESGPPANGGQKRLVFHRCPDGRYPGLWGHALNTKQPFFTNSPSHGHSASAGLPVGHQPIHRLLAVPVVIAAEVLGEVVLANSSRDYSDKDVIAVQRVAAHYALAVQRLRFRQALQAERDFVEAILSTAGALVVVLDTQHHVVRLNPAFEKATGYASQEIQGRVFEQVCLPEHEVSDFLRTLEQLEKGSPPVQGESSWRARDGSLRHVLWANTLLRDEHKGSHFFVITGVDVTETRAVEEKVRVLTRAMESGPAGVVITDKEGTISYINRAFASIVGYDRNEVIGRQPRLWRSGCHPQSFYQELWQTLKQGRVWRGEFCNRKKNGELCWVHSSISPVADPSGEVRHLVAVTVDITERKRFEDALKGAQLELEHKVEQRTADLNASLDALKLEVEARHRAEMEREQLTRVARAATIDQFAASLAHELRQPLTAIMSNAEAAGLFLSQQPPNFPEVEEALRDILSNGDRASDVIRRLRALYRKTGTEHAPLDVNKVVEDTLGLLRSELIFRRVSCRIELEPELPAALGNRVELQQVIMNLVLNAADAMSGVDPEGRLLVVSTGHEGLDRVRVGVRDSGVGLSSEAVKKLFEPFFTTKESGMGMGLSLCQTIITAHSGRLWAEKNPDAGVTFYFTLPVHLKASL